MTSTLAAGLPSLLALSLLACADDDGAETAADASETAGESGETGSGESGETGEPLEPPALPLCGTEPPAGATLAPELPTYGGPGSCPTIETGIDTINIMQTDHGEREFMVIAPSDLQADEQLPVVFMYHWLGGDALDFAERGEAQIAADHYRVIAVLPEGRDNSTGVPFRWPFSIIDGAELFDEEFAFHDDMLACVAEQFSVDKECVSSMGVSAGAMFTAMLAGIHGEHLASFVSLSGGTGGDLVQPWTPTDNHMPALVLWGGRSDFCLGVEFDQGSMRMETALEADNHFVLECIHNCAHSIPPFETFELLPLAAPAFEFALDHPFWLEDGESPYYDYVEAVGGLPEAYPQWCAIGAGNASIREGECGPSEC